MVTPDPDGVVLLSRIELGWLLRSGKQMADQVGVALGKTWVYKEFVIPWSKTFSWPIGSYGLVSAGVLVARISSATCLTCLCGIHTVM